MSTTERPYYRCQQSPDDGFRAFMNRTVGPGYIVLGYRCWRVGGVLITDWIACVKVYYVGGKRTHWFYPHCEMLRKAIHRLMNQPQPLSPTK